ncbi:MAG: lytic murein transglycosylase [Desulfobacterales bacterium]
MFSFPAFGLPALSVLSIILFSAVSAPAEVDYRHFNFLKRKLVADGFDEERISALFKDPDLSFTGDVAASYFRHQESKLNYKQFTSDHAIEKAKNYMDEYGDELSRIQEAFGVDKTVITAIMLVETRLGTYVGTRPVLRTLSTIASLENHISRDILWREHLNSYKLSRKKYDRKALRKAGWAYRELKALLTYAERENVDPASIVGSYAGAVGIAQFMPTNILSLGMDGDQDGSVDLFTHPDAIASIANYLKNSGWKPGIDREKAFKIIYSYNHSRYYVNTILEISDLLKG